MKLAKLLDSQ